MVTSRERRMKRRETQHHERSGNARPEVNRCNKVMRQHCCADRGQRPTEDYS